MVYLKKSEWAADAYQQARDRDQEHYQALRGLGARWTRILWTRTPLALLDHHTTYDPTIHLQTHVTPAQEPTTT